MLKFTIARTGKDSRPGFIVSAGEHLDLVEVHEPRTGIPDTWVVWVLDLGDVGRAASLLHALELGLAVAARWIAVELLKDPTKNATTDAGVLLSVVKASDLRGSENEILFHGLHALGKVIEQNAHTWSVTEFEDDLSQAETVLCASREQALAVLVEHAAPWIAAALVKEVAEIGRVSVSFPAPEDDWFEVESALDDDDGIYWSAQRPPVKHPTYESALAAASADIGLFGCKRIVHHRPSMKSTAVVKVVKREA